MQNKNAVLSIGYDLTIRVNHAGALSPVDAAEYSDVWYRELECAISAVAECGCAMATASPPDPQAATNPHIFGIHAYASHSVANGQFCHNSLASDIAVSAIADYMLLRDTDQSLITFWFSQPLYDTPHILDH